MHSTFSRLQNIFGFFTTVASCVAVAVTISMLLIPQTPSGTLQLRNVQVVKGRPHYYSTRKEEYAHIKFDLDIDLSSLYHWNTKQVFLYISALYPSESPSEPPSQAVIWDAILPSKSAWWHQNQFVHPSSSRDDKSKRTGGRSGRKKTQSSSAGAASSEASDALSGIVKLSNQRPKYQVTDHSGLIATRQNATLELGWNVQPWVGALVWTHWGDFGRWSGMKGGRSKNFDFPALAGSQGSTLKKEELKTATGAEKNTGSPA